MWAHKRLQNQGRMAAMSQCFSKCPGDPVLRKHPHWGSHSRQDKSPLMLTGPKLQWGGGGPRREGSQCCWFWVREGSSLRNLLTCLP